MRVTSTTVWHALVLRYRNPDNALAWLCEVLGFALSHEDRYEQGNLRYAQLKLGTALVIIGRVGDAGFDGLMAQPDEVGGAVTSVPYFVVDDIEQHYARALAAGTEIVLELCEYEAGGCGYTCKDIEGHAWSFGSYRPWGPFDAAPVSRNASPSWRRFSTISAMVLIGALSAAAGGSWLLADGSMGEIQRSKSNGTAFASTGTAQGADDTAALVDALATLSRARWQRVALCVWPKKRVVSLSNQLENGRSDHSGTR